MKTNALKIDQLLLIERIASKFFFDDFFNLMDPKTKKVTSAGVAPLALVIHRVVSVSELQRMSFKTVRDIYYRWISASSRGLL